LCASPWHFIESSVGPDLGGCSELPFGWETLPDVEIRFIRKAMEYGTCTPIDRAYDSIFFPCDSLSSHFRLYGSPASVYRFVDRVHDQRFGSFLPADCTLENKRLGPYIECAQRAHAQSSSSGEHCGAGARLGTICGYDRQLSHG
jgi:hypothetical protein